MINLFSSPIFIPLLQGLVLYLDSYEPGPGMVSILFCLGLEEIVNDGEAGRPYLKFGEYASGLGVF